METRELSPVLVGRVDARSPWIKEYCLTQVPPGDWLIYAEVDINPSVIRWRWGHKPSLLSELTTSRRWSSFMSFRKTVQPQKHTHSCWNTDMHVSQGTCMANKLHIKWQTGAPRLLRWFVHKTVLALWQTMVYLNHDNKWHSCCSHIALRVRKLPAIHRELLINA